MADQLRDPDGLIQGDAIIRRHKAQKAFRMVADVEPNVIPFAQGLEGLQHLRAVFIIAGGAPDTLPDVSHPVQGGLFPLQQQGDGVRQVDHLAQHPFLPHQRQAAPEGPPGGLAQEHHIRELGRHRVHPQQGGAGFGEKGGVGLHLRQGQLPVPGQGHRADVVQQRAEEGELLFPGGHLQFLRQRAGQQRHLLMVVRHFRGDQVHGPGKGPDQVAQVGKCRLLHGVDPLCAPRTMAQSGGRTNM